MAMSLVDLDRFLAQNVEKIEAVEREVEELQIGFNSAYTEFKAEHDATLARLTEKVIEKIDSLEPEMRAQIEKQREEEREKISARMDELREELIPNAQEESDGILQTAQAEHAEIRKLNPKLNDREETYKAQKAELETELAQLNEEIRQLSGCLGFVINFLKISRLDRQRQRVIGQLENLALSLAEVRREWQEAQQKFASRQEELQKNWRVASLKLARLREELAYLEDEENREALALKRAAFNLLDNLKSPAPCADAELKSEVDKMVELNVKTDDYQESLGEVAGLIALLIGVRTGMDSIKKSVEAMIQEQQMHGEYLRPLQVDVPPEVIDFHKTWDGLRKEVLDEGKVCSHPRDFIAFCRQLASGRLGKEAIERMFDSLGQALNRAAASWKG